LRKILKPAHQFQVQQAWGQAVGQGVGGIGEIFDQLIRDRIGAVDQIEHFKGRPDILEIAERAVSAAVAFFTVQQ